MKLFTTLGIELTFGSKYHSDYYAKHGVSIMDSGIYSVDPMLSTLSGILRTKLADNNVSVWHCGTDPACVEVPTVTHSTLHGLMRDVSAITRHAKAIELTPQPGFYCGGGAHIHAGIPKGVDPEAFANRVTVYLAQNPWLCWAFSSPNDTVNAKPIKKGECIGRTAVDRCASDVGTYADCLEQQQVQMQNYAQNMHTVAGWVDRAYWQRNVQWMQYRMMANRKHLYRAKKKLAEALAVANEPYRYDDVAMRTTKGHALAYREGMGTIEFRAFLMPHTVAGHRKHIALVDRIMRKLGKQMANTGYDGDAMWDGDTMPYKQAKAGFLAMLADLGLKPEDYRAEVYRMALRHRKGRGLK